MVQFTGMGGDTRHNRCAKGSKDATHHIWLGVPVLAAATEWGASQFLSKQLFVGLVGYAYQQLSDDTGPHPIQAGFRSRVLGVGPQIGYIFPIGNMQGYLNLKGYGEFDAQDRPHGWNTWLTFAISPAAPESTVTPTRRIVTKQAQRGPEQISGTPRRPTRRPARYLSWPEQEPIKYRSPNLHRIQDGPKMSF